MTISEIIAVIGLVLTLVPLVAFLMYYSCKELKSIQDLRIAQINCYNAIETLCYKKIKKYDNEVTDNES